MSASGSAYFQVQDLAGVIFSDHMSWEDAQSVKDENAKRYQRPFKVVVKRFPA